MSQYYRENGDYYTPEYNDGRTKQSFKDSTDVNKIITKMAKTGALSHLDKFGGEYGDFAKTDLFEAQLKLARGQEIFDQLPAELKREFDQSPPKFFAYVNKAGNDVNKLRKVFPQLAEPGRMMPKPNHGFRDTPEGTNVQPSGGGTGGGEKTAPETTGEE
jgi:hypothetical protein